MENDPFGCIPYGIWGFSIAMLVYCSVPSIRSTVLMVGIYLRSPFFEVVKTASGFATILEYIEYPQVSNFQCI